MIRPAKPIARPAALLAALLASAPPFPFGPEARAQDAAACLEKATTAPDFALADARAWIARGGGGDAKLCEAIALLGLGSWEAAATALTAVIGTLPDPSAQRSADLWAKASTAWAKAGQPARAEEAIGRAIALSPKDAGLRIDRATLLAGQERYWDALAELDRALALEPDSVVALTLRAVAHRRLGRDTEALADLGRALAIRPDDGQALLLRGNLRADRGEFDAARADWLKARALPGDSATAASENLAALDRVAAENGGSKRADSKASRP